MTEEHRDGINAIVINLARRNQLLVEKQLGILEEMQRDERDPRRLTALFKVDDVASRLRRNAENLLVVSGGQVRRRPGDGMPLDALVLAALAEIEHYQRVRTDVDDSVKVSGHVTGDLIHLLAELFDNAVAFSPPASAVRVTSATRDDAVTLEITDQGIGLGADALQQANEVLSTPPALSADVAERMGLVVISHLAARYQVQVRLRSSHTGTCAAVRVPRALLINEGAA